LPRRLKNDLIADMNWDYVLIFVVLGGVVPLMGRRRIRQLMKTPATTKSERYRLYLSTTGSQWIASAFVFWRAHMHGIASAQMGIGVFKPALTLIVTVFFTALILANQIIALRKLGEHPAEVRGVMPQLAMRVFPQDTSERIAFTGVVVTVALCEEFLFRGFVQHAFQSWSHGSAIAAILGSSLLFAWAHFYQGRRGLISTFIAGLLFSTMRFWTLSLLPSIIAHFGADIVVGFMAPARFRAAFAMLQATESRNQISSPPTQFAKILYL
jgi:membrane protease YdiL (CAAX protease family)